MDNKSITKAPTSKPEPKGWDFMNAADIQDTEYPEAVFVVDGLIHKGATILAARPKFGKSWWALQIAIAVSTGRKAFGRFNVPQAGRVLYLALEDTKSRIKRRLAMLSPDNERFSGITCLCGLPNKLGATGEIKISSYLQERKGEYSLVIIDTMLAAFESNNRRDIVKADYDRSAILKPELCTAMDVRLRAEVQ